MAPFTWNEGQSRSSCLWCITYVNALLQSSSQQHHFVSFLFFAWYTLYALFSRHESAVFLLGSCSCFGCLWLFALLLCLLHWFCIRMISGFPSLVLAWYASSSIYFFATAFVFKKGCSVNDLLNPYTILGRKQFHRLRERSAFFFQRKGVSVKWLVYPLIILGRKQFQLRKGKGTSAAGRPLVLGNHCIPCTHGIGRDLAWEVGLVCKGIPFTCGSAISLSGQQRAST